MAKFDTSPYHYAQKDSSGRSITIDIHYNPATITRDGTGYPTGGGQIVAPGLECHRDPGCLFDEIVYGAEGRKGRRSVAVPEGDTTVSVTLLRNQGYELLIDDVLMGAGFTVQQSE